jgi:hypothetical protein
VRTGPAGTSHAYFVSGGSEAVEAALKMARQYFGGATAGVLTPVPGYFKAVREVCDRSWRAVDPGRSDVRHGAARHAARMRGRRRGAGPAGCRQGAGWRLPAHRRGAGASKDRGGDDPRLPLLPAWAHLPGASRRLRSRARGAGSDRTRWLAGPRAKR